MRLSWRWTAAITLGLWLLVVGVGPAAAVRLNLRWKYVAAAAGVVGGPRWVFVNDPGVDGQGKPGGTLIDDQTGRERPIVLPAEFASSCGEASAIGGPWLAFECSMPPHTNQPATHPVALYRISTRQWRMVPEAVDGPVLGVGADWIEIWASQVTVMQPSFVFQNIYTGRTRPLAGWQPGGSVIPNLNSPTLGRDLCGPVRVPDDWQGSQEDWPGTVSFNGPYAVVGGTTRDLNAFGYLERCGTRMHRWIGPLGPSASANTHAVVWQRSRSASDVEGAYLPSLKHFTVNTTKLVNSLVSPYYGGPNTYSTWLSSRTLYVLVQPYFPNCDPTNPCPRPTAQLYAAAAPRQPHPRGHHR